MLRAKYWVILVITMGLVGTVLAIPVKGGLVLNPGASWLPRFQSAQIEEQNHHIGGPSLDFDFVYELAGYDPWPELSLVSGSMERGRTPPLIAVSAHFGQESRTASFASQLVRFGFENAAEASTGNWADSSGLPEPDTMILLGAGLLTLAGIGRRFTRT